MSTNRNNAKKLKSSLNNKPLTSIFQNSKDYSNAEIEQVYFTSINGELKGTINDVEEHYDSLDYRWKCGEVKRASSSSRTNLAIHVRLRHSDYREVIKDAYNATKIN